MRRGQAFPSNFISKEDVQGGDLILTVKNVAIEKIKSEGGEDEKPVMHFRDHDKSLVLNGTNWDTTAAVYGEDSDGWVGKRVVLFLDPTVRFGKQLVGGVRIRIPEHIPIQRMAGGESLLSWDSARATAAAVGMTEDELKKRLKAKGLTGYNAKKDGPMVHEVLAAWGQDKQAEAGQIAAGDAAASLEDRDLGPGLRDDDSIPF